MGGGNLFMYTSKTLLMQLSENIIQIAGLPVSFMQQLSLLDLTIPCSAFLRENKQMDTS